MTANLNELLKPGDPLPADEVMIAKAFEILEHSPHGQRLVDMTRKESIEIKIIATPTPTAYMPETRKIYIGFNRNHPISPSTFVVTLAGILREAEQELGGLKLHPPTSTEQEHVKTALAKHEDKLWYMCTVAIELDDQDTFAQYYFLDALRKMGHTEIVDLYLKQEGR